MSVKDKRMNKTVVAESQSLCYFDHQPTQTFQQHKDEYFYGGGMQNGRFTHKGEVIIMNSNKWVDGGVSSPCPFFWSTYGYGVLRNTWQPGVYDFGSKARSMIKTSHKGFEFDAFYFINSKPSDILCDYYELTGRPIMLPEYAFYEAHFDAFNRDYWVQVDSDMARAIMFEDGLYYKCYKPDDMKDRVGILESLNGENDNYQFSARGMVDRYKRHDMPLGWFIPNDGYGCGYGQTTSMDGDIANLKEFVNYSKSHGVEVALWTESNLHPVDPNHPKKGERDLVKEVEVAGVVGLMCDVAWIGKGYSFGLTAIEGAHDMIVRKTKTNVRPMMLTVDGWAGTQRYSGIWSGDQSGGDWEYIRFHIPTFVGCGLSGIPIVGSDMDGIYGGGLAEINTRDYQWKTFTPLQLNMDGWGSNRKAPFAYDDDTTDINRAYLKMKSMLMPYNYSIAYESIQGLPMIRALFLEFPQEKMAFKKSSTQYQFMWGPNILVAPIYEGVYSDGTPSLPGKEDYWYNFLTGERYMGGKVYKKIPFPLWHLPVFIRSGAIIPMTNPNNNPTEIDRSNRIFTMYPYSDSSLVVYEDDGLTSDYAHNRFALTQINMFGPKATNNDTLLIDIAKTEGDYDGMVKERTTLLQIIASQPPEEVTLTLFGKTIKLALALDETEFEKRDNIYFYNFNFYMNPYLQRFNQEAMKQTFILVKIQNIDIMTDDIQLKITGYANNFKTRGDLTVTNSLSVPPRFLEISSTNTSTALEWNLVKGAEYYEIENDDTIYTNIKENNFTIKDLEPNTKYSFKVRTVVNDEASEWSDAIEIITEEDPFVGTVDEVTITREESIESYQSYLSVVSSKLSSLWSYSEASEEPQERIVRLTFDLGAVHDISKVCYILTDDAAVPLVNFEYQFSIDGENWFDVENTATNNNKTVAKLITAKTRRFRYMKMKFVNTDYDFDNGKQVLFYKDDK